MMDDHDAGRAVELMLDVNRMLVVLPSNPVHMIDCISKAMSFYHTFEEWSKLEGLEELPSAAFAQYCKALTDALFQARKLLGVDVEPVLDWFTMARAETEGGFEIKPAASEYAQVLKVWAKLRFAARESLGANAQPQDPDNARKKKGLELWNLGKSWREVAIEIDGTDESVKAVMQEIKRYADSAGLEIREDKPGRKPKRN